jgi:hypothetical protein
LFWNNSSRVSSSESGRECSYEISECVSVHVCGSVINMGCHIAFVSETAVGRSWRQLSVCLSDRRLTSYTTSSVQLSVCLSDRRLTSYTTSSVQLSVWPETDQLYN